MFRFTIFVFMVGWLVGLLVDDFCRNLMKIPNTLRWREVGGGGKGMSNSWFLRL